jgi:F-type H+-transporting ATPase subunit epsilon
MSDKFIVEIITPNSSIFKEEATEVIIPSYEGQMGILKNHIPLITFLRPGIISVKSKDEKKFFVEEGTVEFSNGNLLILTSAVKNINDLDKSFIEKIIKDCQDKMGNVEISDKEKYLLSHKIDTLREIN